MLIALRRILFSPPSASQLNDEQVTEEKNTKRHKQRTHTYRQIKNLHTCIDSGNFMFKNTKRKEDIQIIPGDKMRQLLPRIKYGGLAL